MQIYNEAFTRPQTTVKQQLGSRIPVYSDLRSETPTVNWFLTKQSFVTAGNISGDEETSVNPTMKIPSLKSKSANERA